MKELRKKTLLTIFSILSVILVAGLTLVNARNYIREKEDIQRNLDILEQRGKFWNDRFGPDDNEVPPEMPADGELPPGEPPSDAFKDDFPGDQRLSPSDLENMIIMDYELYTVELKDGEIDGIFSLGNSSDDFDVESAVNEILAKETGDSLKIGNLYFARYCYRYRSGESIVILNNKEITQKLLVLLIESIGLFILLEAAIYFASRLITKWITKPAAEAFDRQKEFIADASHELKTPLAVIMASADAITVNEEEQKNLDNIRYESDRMSRLIAGLLNLSKLENGGDPSLHQEEDLSRILEKTCLAYEGVAFEQGISIDTDIEEGLTLKCNKEEIEQMAATILDNAVRHSYKDTSVRVKAKKVKGVINIDVINSGDPIPEEDREKIFERFYRGDKARSRQENRYGLGLAIARRIARNHGGDIKAFSENGETVFNIILK